MSRRAPRGVNVPTQKRRASEVVVPLGRDSTRKSNDSATTPVAFDASEERFIDFLVEEALKAWRTKTS